MVWWRRGALGLCTLLLLVSLLGLAKTSSSNAAFGKPDKLKVWIGQSDFYKQFIDYTLSQAQKSVGEDSSLSAAFRSSGVRKAAETALPKEDFQKKVDTIIDANYAWLEGKTAKPTFFIDLTANKQAFSKQVGEAARSRLETLQVCNIPQLEQFKNSQSVNPFTTPCQPAILDIDTEVNQLVTQINNSNNFLKNPVITAEAINPTQATQGQPYYLKLSSAPKLYKFSKSLPIVFAVLAILSVAAIILLAPERRRAVRRIAICLLLAGILLIATDYLWHSVVNKAEHNLITGADTAQLQKSISSIGDKATTQLTKVNTEFGTAFIIIAVGLFASLFATRDRDDTPRPTRPAPVQRPTIGKKSPPPPEPTPLTPKRPSPDQYPRFKKPEKPDKPKPPRLIQ